MVNVTCGGKEEEDYLQTIESRLLEEFGGNRQVKKTANIGSV